MSAYTVEIVGRGEDVLYREGAHELWASIAFHGATIDLDVYNLIAWDTPRNLTLSEAKRSEIIQRIVAHIQTPDHRVRLVTEPPPSTPQGLVGRDAVEYRERGQTDARQGELL